MNDEAEMSVPYNTYKTGDTGTQSDGSRSFYRPPSASLLGKSNLAHQPRKLQLGGSIRRAPRSDRVPSRYLVGSTSN